MGLLQNQNGTLVLVKMWRERLQSNSTRSQIVEPGTVARRRAAAREEMPLVAVEYIRGMRGGAQSKLMRASDSNLYVVKFQDNPQTTRILVNEFLGTRIAALLGLPVPAVQVISVDQELINRTSALRIEWPKQTVACKPGRHVASEHSGSGAREVFDFLPSSYLAGNVVNRAAFAGVLAFDHWTCNGDRRQAVFVKATHSPTFHVMFIDQGGCFNGDQWSYSDSAIRGLYMDRSVYVGVTGWHSFEPWLSAIENVDESSIWTIVREVPPEWYVDSDPLNRLVERLFRRKSLVADLISSAARGNPSPFLNWRMSPLWAGSIKGDVKRKHFSLSQGGVCQLSRFYQS